MELLQAIVGSISDIIVGLQKWLHWPSLLIAYIAAALSVRSLRPSILFPKDIVRHPSTIVDVKILLVLFLFYVGFLTPLGLTAEDVGQRWLSVWVDLFGERRVAIELTPTSWELIYAAVTFLFLDLSRYLLHRMFHQVPWLWRFHKVHHSAEVLTPLTLFRNHPVEIVLHAVRVGTVTGCVTGCFVCLCPATFTSADIYAVNVFVLGFNLLLSNLHHSHFWIGFGRVEYWIISPAQHQMHHHKQLASGVNYGTWLSLWDRLFKSWRPSRASGPSEVGLPDHERNHDPRDWVSALAAPVGFPWGQ